jgi:hypothetical protein
MIVIYTILLIVFFGGSLEAYNLVPPLFNWLTEPLIYALLVFSIIKKGIQGSSVKTPLLLHFIFFLIIGAASSFVNGRINLHVLFSVRLIIRFYILYLAVVNLELSEKQSKRILLFLIILFLIQIPTAMIKLAIYGQGESAIGTYSVNEGSLSTMIPLIAIGYIASFYIYSKKLFWSLVMCLGFVAFSLIGGKRALVFLLPVFGIFIISILMFTGEFKNRLVKVSIAKTGIIFSLSGLLIVCLGLIFIPTLNPERKVGGSIDFSHALTFASEYTTNTVGQTGSLAPTGGRLSTSKRIFNVMTTEGFSVFLFGYGPGSYTDSRFGISRSRMILQRKLNIIYGVTPLGYIQIEYGFFGVMTYLFLLLFLLFKIIRGWQAETERYWKTFLLGSSCCSFIMIILWACYHPPSMLGDTIPCVFFLLMGIATTRIQNLRS